MTRQEYKQPSIYIFKMTDKTVENIVIVTDSYSGMSMK